MIIAEELDLPVDKVRVTLAPARPELLFNQLTGGSNTTVSTFTPVRVAAAIAKGALLEAAAIELGSAVALLKSKDGVITAPGGGSRHLRRPRREGRQHRSPRPSTVAPQAQQRVHGDRQARSTGSTPATSSPARRSSRWTSRSRTRCRRWSAARRRSTARPRAIRNKADGADDARRHRRRARSTPASPSAPRPSASASTPCARCRSTGTRAPSRASPTRPCSPSCARPSCRSAIPKVPVLAKTVEADFTFMFRSSAALEPYAAIADVRPDRAEIWAGLKSPIVAQDEIAKAIGLPHDQGEGQRRSPAAAPSATSCSATTRSRRPGSPRRWASRSG